MSVATSTAQSSSSFDALSGSGDSLIGMTMLGKTAAALALVIAIILLCTAALKRWQSHRAPHNANLRIVGNTAVGNRERIVVVEIEDTWLVVGVGGGRITKLHERPAPDERPVADAPAPPSRFAKRLAHAMGRSKTADDTASSSDQHRQS